MASGRPPGVAFPSLPEGVFIETAVKEVPEHVARSGPDREEWKRAQVKEVSKLVGNAVWQLVPPHEVPPDAQILPGRWVLVLKYVNGVFDKRKARWVVRGDLQKKGYTFSDVYAPVANMDSVHIFFAFLAINRFEGIHVDFDAAFSNSDIDMPGIYVRQPRGLEEKGREDWLCLLRKALYGLRQAPRLWHRDVIKLLLGLDFESVGTDSCLLVLRVIGKIVMIVLLHVDDLAIGFDKEFEGRHEVIKALTTKFDSKIMPLECFLSLSVRRDVDKGVILSQEPMVRTVLGKYSKWVGNEAHSPMDPNVKLVTYYDRGPEDAEPELADPGFPFKPIIGSLIYLNMTRIDIAFAVNFLSHFQLKPLKIHQNALSRVLGYLRSHPSECIHYQAGAPMVMHAYADASHLTDARNSLSQIAHIAFLAGAPIAWRTVMPKIPYLSSTTAEIAALREAVKAVLTLRMTLVELGMPAEPTPIFEDNAATVQVCVEIKHTTRLRHVLKDCNFLQFHASVGTFVAMGIKTTHELADWLTKAFAKAKHERFTRISMDCVPLASH
jgi:hypothetical protein